MAAEVSVDNSNRWRHLHVNSAAKVPVEIPELEKMHVYNSACCQALTAYVVSYFYRFSIRVRACRPLKAVHSITIASVSCNHGTLLFR